MHSECQGRNVIVGDAFSKRCAGKNDKETVLAKKAVGIRNVDTRGVRRKNKHERENRRGERV